jgi:methylmalonyl-CoA mutase N-terminal domain/subunit
MHVDPERARQLRAEYDEAVLREGKELAGPFMTVSGRPINRVYDPTDTADLDYERDINLPGNYPFTRGIHRTGYRGKPWTIRMFSGFGSVEETNQRYKDLLAAGNNGLSIAFDMPTLMGYDHDDPWAEGEFGACGVAVDHLGDMELLLEGIPLDKITTSMTINSPAPVVWALFIAAAEKRGIPRAKLAGTLQNDILKEYIAQNEFIYPPADSMRLVTDTIEFASKEMPLWNPISVSGYHIREAGSTAVQELAWTLADGFEYVEAALKRGLDIDEFAPRISFFFDVHNDFFEEIAKFRAARRIWAKEMRNRYGAKNPQSWMLRTHAQTAGVSLTAQQPLNNIARVAIQALAAVLGGTNSLHTDAYDEALALPTEESATIALRTQQIIAYETGVTHTIDPLAGSYYVEWLTDEMERQAMAIIEEIRRMGGVVRAIEEGYFLRELAEASYRYQQEVERKERIIVGVNAFTDEIPLKVPIQLVDPEVERVQAERLARVRRERDPRRVEEALAGLRQAAVEGQNTMPHFVECALAYCTLGEMMDVLREVYGTYQEPAYV